MLIKNICINCDDKNEFHCPECDTCYLGPAKHPRWDQIFCNIDCYVNWEKQTFDIKLERETCRHFYHMRILRNPRNA